MQRLKKEIEKAITTKYVTKKAWFDKNNIHPQRFYNFLKGRYNPTLLTLKQWLKSLDLELTARTKKKSS